MRCRNFAATLGVFTIAVASILTPSAAHATVSGTSLYTKDIMI
jgi:hypothetical protein